ncbi:hypothetical protein TYRP_001899 [Tyrophagus putrescentiae]|nr:hypothetical protein TYRP_001899 [Tyrophagus putrescentiae]
MIAVTIPYQFAVHNHYPMRCINTTGHHSCNGMTIDPKMSILMHYRRNRSPPEKCPTPNDLIKCSVKDTTAWRWFDKISNNVKEKLKTIFQ